MWHRSLALVAVLAAVLSVTAMAQGNHGMDADHPWWGHGVTFWSQASPEGCWLCSPSIDINGGLFSSKDAASSSTNYAFVRLHTQIGLGIPYISLASDVNFIPTLGATPTFSMLAQFEPLRTLSRVYTSAGIGLITGHDPGADRMEPWAQATLAYRSIIHDLTPFVQVGSALNSGQKLELLFGIAHPLAPYKMHWTLDK
ncbi:MAG: hypothetical protein ACREL4_02320 [Gemmatimonadales bacterium]